jgi:hypothetical protein
MIVLPSINSMVHLNFGARQYWQGMVGCNGSVLM